MGRLEWKDHEEGLWALGFGLGALGFGLWTWALAKAESLEPRAVYDSHEW
jgi:hypothetical protein